MHDAGARARARASVARPANPLGPGVRATADAGQAMALAELGRHIRPGYVLRLERLRPSWCGGWVDDIAVESTSMSELYSQIREEFGGTHFRVIVLGVQETPIYEGRITIAEPPRRRGRPINRDDWEQALDGRTRAANPQPVAVAAAPAVSDANAGLQQQLIQMLFDQQRQTSTATLDAVREMTTRTATMVSEVLQRREDNSSRGSLAAQLGELVEGTRAIQKAGRVFGAAAGSGDGGEDVNDSMVKQAGSLFLAKLAGDMMGPKQPNGHAQHPAQGPGFIPVSQPIPSSSQK